jgi:hypothetical protein
MAPAWTILGRFDVSACLVSRTPTLLSRLVHPGDDYRRVSLPTCPIPHSLFLPRARISAPLPKKEPPDARYAPPFPRVTASARGRSRSRTHSGRFHDGNLRIVARLSRFTSRAKQLPRIPMSSRTHRSAPLSLDEKKKQSSPLP